MSKRNWADIKALEAIIMELRAERKTRQEIADKLGLNFVQIKNWVNRHKRSPQSYSSTATKDFSTLLKHTLT